MFHTMRNPDAKHIDFGFLKGIIDSNPAFLPSNIDMVLERKGRFMFGEWKREDEEIKKGQKVLLSKLATHHTVILITGHVDDDAHVSAIHRVNANHTLSAIGNSKSDLIEFIQNWYDAIEKKIL